MSEIYQSETKLTRSASASISCNFKSVSRNKQANWGNRFLRDHYDLVYEANPQSIENRLSKTSNSKRKVAKKEEVDPELLMKYKYTPFKGRTQSTIFPSTGNLQAGLNSDQYLNTMKVFESKLREGAETAPHTQRKKIANRSKKFEERECHSPVMGDIVESSQQEKDGSNQYGLSRYQYNQTLRGKMELRLNHHIDFNKNKTAKINNINRVWYNDNEDLADQKLKQPHKNDKIHNFRSYSSHKLFFRTKRQLEDNGTGNGGMLDKFYNTVKPYIENRQHGLGNVYNHSTMTGKPGLPKKEGTNLDYNTQQLNVLGQGDGKRGIIERMKCKRQLVFGRQVIDPKRACYR